MKNYKNFYGIITCSLISIAATFLSSMKIGSFNFDIVGTPVFAILIGMMVTLQHASFAGSDKFKPGITFTSKKILQYAVILLGFSLNLGLILKVGMQSIPIILSTILTSLIVAFIAMKALKIDGTVATLIGVGSSICGGSAVAATAPVVNASDEEIAQAISVIFVFNVLAALIFPVFGYRIGLGTEGFAIFAGTAVNDTSSVTAAAATAEGIYGVSGILSTAVTVKLTRTLAIIPITLALAFWQTKKAASTSADSTASIIHRIFPWFILYFLGAAILTTLAGFLGSGAFYEFYQDSFVVWTKTLSKFFIAMAMAAIGLNTNVAQLVKKGGKPILLGFLCWISITMVSLLMQYGTGLFYSSL